ncbi:MAG: phosphogluconate dehydratase [Beijerinckiaceae bacterium]
MMNSVVREVTNRIMARSHDLRLRYLDHVERDAVPVSGRSCLSCSNLAHVMAPMADADKKRLAGLKAPNIGIVTAYNDMLSAHQPFATYPDIIRKVARRKGATAQVAGGVPAMCDGVTQGRPGMELSLFSRDVIAMSTAVALTHDAFDAAICLGTCDKIIPGLLIGALQFPHLPVVFSGAGPMPTGISNAEKSAVRQRHAEGKATQEELLESEARAYHAPGTCTFYGTANSNQVLVEVMGLHMPGTAFAPPGTPLRAALLQGAIERLTEVTKAGAFTPIGRIVDEKAIVNAVVALLATGGSTNHTMHWVAVARAAGIILTWDDFSDLAAVVPLLARVYPNGEADVNAFERAGGIPYLIRECLDAGLMHDDVLTIAGPGLRRYTRCAVMKDGVLGYEALPAGSGAPDVLRPVSAPFETESGLRILAGNMGKAVIKTSAVKPANRKITAPARIFDSQDALHAAFKAGHLRGDFIAVLRFQGPRANGMPELHKLTPVLGILMDRGHKVALVTDGRMSGASGKVPAAIHVTPEASEGGILSLLQDGDVITLDSNAGLLEAHVSATELAARKPALQPTGAATLGRGLFAPWRSLASPADQGASIVGSLV